VDAERPDHPGLTTRERAARDLRVVQDRARGISWVRIGERHGITDRQARRVVADYRQSRTELRDHDPVAIVEEVLEAQEAALDDLALLAETTTNASVELGAIRSKLQVHRERLELLGAIGVFPRDIGQVGRLIDLREIATRLDRVLNMPDVPRDLRERIIAAVDPRASESRPVAMIQSNGVRADLVDCPPG
jgi:hypothetical protein